MTTNKPPILNKDDDLAFCVGCVRRSLGNVSFSDSRAAIEECPSSWNSVGRLGFAAQVAASGKNGFGLDRFRGGIPVKSCYRDGKAMFLPSNASCAVRTGSRDRCCFSGSKSPERAGLFQTEVQRDGVGNAQRSLAVYTARISKLLPMGLPSSARHRDRAGQPSIDSLLDAGSLPSPFEGNAIARGSRTRFGDEQTALHPYFVEFAAPDTGGEVRRKAIASECSPNVSAGPATFVRIGSRGDHMTGTITKRFRRDGKFAWGYSFFAGRTPEGKRIQMTKSGFETRKDAADALRKAIEQHKSVSNTAGRVSFSVFLKGWLDEHAKHRCTPKTLERYEQLGQHAIKYLGDTEVQSLAPIAIESMLNSLRNCGDRKDEAHPNGRPLSPRTVRHIAFLIHDSLESAVRWNILPTNPMDRVVLPKVGKKEVTALDKEDLNQLLGAFRGTSLFPLFVTAASTGCRRGELLALQWRDIDFQTAMITISKSLEQTKKGLRIKSTKSNETRRFPLPSVAIDVLLEHRRNQQQQDPKEVLHTDLGLVFCRPDGTYCKPDQISSRIAEVTAKAGLRGISLHSMRHSHASQLLSQGVPIPTVSKRLGHANPSITLKLYSHALESDELDAAKRWDDAYADVVSQTHDNRHG